MWNYTLFDRVRFGQFYNVTGGKSRLIASTYGGSTTVETSFQKRFRAHMSDTQARLTILKVQTSDQEKYGLDIYDRFFDVLTHMVELIVQCK